MDRLRLVFLLVVLAACAPAHGPVSVDIGPASSAAAPATGATSLSLTRRVLFLKAVVPEESRFVIWQVGDGPATTRAVGPEITVPTEPLMNDSLSACYEVPRLSPDGKLLAYLRRGDLMLWHVDGGAGERVFEDKQGLRTTVCAFAPNGKALLLHLRKGDVEDPENIDAGYYELTLASRQILPRPSLGGFAVWDPDSRHVLFVTFRGDLNRSDLSGHEVTALQSGGTSDFLYLSFSPRGDLITHAVRLNAVVRSKPDGTDRVVVAPPGISMERRLPAFSPDGARLAYAQETSAGKGSIEVSSTAGGPSATVLRLKAQCTDLGWESSTSLLVVDGDKLLRVPLDGPTTLLAEGVHGLVLPGQ